jgi:rhodanese-related sulfurtransferase
VSTVAETPAIERRLTQARARIAPRLEARELNAALTDGALVIDTRPVGQRWRDGVLPGALVVERNVLEWRLDPTSPDRLPEMGGPDQRVIIVCDEGYASSLAAAFLLDLGLTRVTDLEGGFQAWRRFRRADRTPDDGYAGAAAPAPAAPASPPPPSAGDPYRSRNAK